MFVLYDYSAILYKSFHFSKSFRCFFSKSIVFLSFSSILQQRMAAPPFPEDWRMTQESLSDPFPPGSARGGFLSPRLVLFPDLSAPHEMKAATERSFFLCWLEEPAATGIGDECGRECNTLIFRYINRMLKREALQEDKQALLGFQTGVSWGVSRPWLAGK